MPDATACRKRPNTSAGDKDGSHCIEKRVIGWNRSKLLHISFELVKEVANVLEVLVTDIYHGSLPSLTFARICFLLNCLRVVSNPRGPNCSVVTVRVRFTAYAK